MEQACICVEFRARDGRRSKRAADGSFRLRRADIDSEQLGTYQVLCDGICRGTWVKMLCWKSRQIGGLDDGKEEAVGGRMGEGGDVKSLRRDA